MVGLYVRDEDSSAPRDAGSCRLSDVQGCAVLAVWGDIDIHTAPRLRDAVAVAREYSSRIVIDITQVRFIASTGLHALRAARQPCGGKRPLVVLVGASAEVRGSLAMARLARSFTMFASIDDAVQSLTALSE